MPRKAAPKRVILKTITITELLRLASTMATSVVAHGWGTFAAIVAFIFWTRWMQTARIAPFMGVTTTCTLGYILGVACFTIISKSTFSAQRCLTRAKLWFETQRITQSEYDQMRSHCLEKCDVISK